jgi:hypothetical protein
MATGTLGGSDNTHNCRVAEIEASGNARQAFPVDVPSADDLADLMRGQFGLATKLDPVLDGARSTFASAHSNMFAFELRQATKYREHKTANVNVLSLCRPTCR